MRDRPHSLMLKYMLEVLWLLVTYIEQQMIRRYNKRSKDATEDQKIQQKIKRCDERSKDLEAVHDIRKR